MHRYNFLTAVNHSLYLVNAIILLLNDVTVMSQIVQEWKNSI